MSSSVKFEKETIRNGPLPTGQGPQGFDRGAPGFDRGAPGFDRGAPGFDRGAPGFDRGADRDVERGVERGVERTREVVHDMAHDLGERLTGGETATGYLQFYLKQLESNPLRTKMLTSGTLSGLQEFLASWIAKDRGRNGSYLSSRIPKMMVYGAFVAAPLGHLLIKILQKTFAGRTSLRAKILQIIVSNLIVSPIQNAVYLTSMAIIAGARTFHQVRATVRAGFWPVMKVSWITSPLALAFAQQFLPEQTWVPFFNIISFVIGTYINAHTKKKRLAALRRKYDEERRGGDNYGRPPPGPY